MKPRMNAGLGLALSLALVAAIPLQAAADVDLTRPCSWSAFDAGEAGVGTNPDGYWGAVFDGRYVYFVPLRNADAHGEVLRYDTQAFFADATSWATFDPGDHGIGTDPDGFDGAVFDGRYVYFVPNSNGTEYHGEVLRFDTTGSFQDPAAWGAFDPGANGVGSDPDGYIGGAFDGRYVYFSPYHNGTSQHGEVLRLDTTGDFDNVASWATYDAGAHGVGEQYGYSGAVFDGRYVYFVPNCTSDTSHHGEVRRYDTTAPFDTATSWAAYDPGEHGVGVDPDGYVEGVFDGQYVYFVPYYDDTGQHGEVLRYDTTGGFTDTASWATFDAGANGIGTDPDGYAGAIFDGRYILFAPYHNGTRFHSEVLRYDTDGSFTDPSAWSTFDPDTLGVINGYGGYAGVVFDGQHAYFTPMSWTDPHGEVLRFNTGSCLGDFDDNGVLNQDDVDQFELCYTGPDAGPPGSGCTPGDFDGDDDVDCDDWMTFVVSWAQPGSPPSLSHCACAAPGAPEPAPSAFATNRYLSLAGGNAGKQTALRIALVDLPAPYDVLNGETMWIGPPKTFCENAGQDTPPTGGCGAAPGLPLTLLAATLQCEPHYANWDALGTIHVYHEVLVPHGQYAVQAIVELCDTANELSYSAPLELAMSRWGDVCSPWTGAGWGAPDGSADVTTDVTAILDKFKNLPGALPKARADIEPAALDQRVNISDITYCLGAFVGESYPPTGFPPPVTPPLCP